MTEGPSFSMPGNLTFIATESIPAHMVPEWQKEFYEKDHYEEVLAASDVFVDKLKTYELHDMLGLTALYTFMKAVIKDGHKTNYPEQADLEVLQAFMLGCAHQLPKILLPRDETSSVWLELTRQNYAATLSTRKEGQASIEAFADIHMAYYRNPYGDDFFDRMIVDITSEYDNRYLRTGDFAQCGKILVFIRKTIWGRFQSFYNTWVNLLGYKRKQLIFFIEKYTNMVGSDVAIDNWRTLNITSLRNYLRNLVEDHAVKNLFKLDRKFLQDSGFDANLIFRVLDSLSLQSVENIRSLKDLTRFNPIVARPFTRSDDGYSIYCLLTLMSFPFASLMTILEEQPNAKIRLEKVRGDFAERETARIISEAFPSAKQVSSGYWYRANGDRVESDLVVLVSRHLLIFEAKGALINDRVRSGASGAIQQFLKKTWGKSTRQGLALSDHIKLASKPVTIEDSKGDVQLILDPREIRTVSRFSVSLEQIGPLMNAPTVLRKLDIIDNHMQPAPCIVLSELAKILETLKDELQRLHYLTRRFIICNRNQIYGDEMDIFSIYFRTGFVGLISSEDFMILLGESYVLSKYRGRDGILRLPKDSALRNSSYFESLISSMQDKKSPLLFDIGLLILDIPYEKQVEFEREMKGLLKARPKADDSPIVFSEVSNVLGSFMVSAMSFDRKINHLLRREMALRTLSHLGRNSSTVEGFVITVLKKSSDPYDALYYAGSLYSGNTSK